MRRKRCGEPWAATPCPGYFLGPSELPSQVEPTEAETRSKLIDEQLAKAGWSTSMRNAIEEYGLQSPSGPSEFADYVLLDRDARPVAIVEAKRSSRDAVAGKRQAEDYANKLIQETGADPFIFLSNGLETWFWDRSLGALREVSTFFSPDDLERLQFIRRHRKALATVEPNLAIAGRDYQLEAIRRVTERMEKGHRNFLLVMATGTGKTRTAVSLVDILLRSKWVQRVLFLVDRRELAKQAAEAFRDHLPKQVLHRIEGGVVDPDASIHIATYPSMIQVYERLSAGYYDLVVADESHRSIYNRYKVLLDHFGSFQLGLTATPTDFIDHNTFQLFGCDDGLPTFYYPYEQAVDDKHLAKYQVLEAKTSFQIDGIRAGELPVHLQRQLEEQGIDLSELNFEGSELERNVTNSGTNDAIVREFMDKARLDAKGTEPAKAIFFCMSHNHAKELWKSFNRLYPDLQRKGFAEIIDSHMERAEDTLDDFKNKPYPRVALSVDMLDTGIDVPAIETLVFAKPVFSQVKFWQMIGRGTRRPKDETTGKEKETFLIIDHWDNFAYFRMNPEGEVASSSVPLPVRLFRARLKKLQQVDEFNERERTADDLRQMLAALPPDNTNVRPHLLDLEDYTDPAHWSRLSDHDIEVLRNTLAPLCRFLPDVSLEAMTFELRTEEAALALLDHDDEATARLQEQIVTDLHLLPLALPEVQAHDEHLRWALSPSFWDNLALERLRGLRDTFAPLMRYRQRQRRELIHLNLPDQIATRRWVVYGPAGEGTFAESYREQVEAYVRSQADIDPILKRIKRGQPVGDDDIEALSERLHGPDLFVTEDALRQAYAQPTAGLADFLRHILGVSELEDREDHIRSAFDDYIKGHPHFSAVQINFLRLVRTAIVARSQLSHRDLEGSPFNRIGSVHRLFSDDELDELITFANGLAA